MARGDGITRLHGAADGGNGGGILFAITLGISARQRRFAEHVERISIVALVLAGSARQGAPDVAAHDELVAENAHGLLERRARHRLAELADEPRIPGTRFPYFVAIECHHASGQHESPGRCIHEQRFGIAEVLIPGAARDLVGNEPVRRLTIGNAQ